MGNPRIIDIEFPTQSTPESKLNRKKGKRKEKTKSGRKEKGRKAVFLAYLRCRLTFIDNYTLFTQ